MTHKNAVAFLGKRSDVSIRSAPNKASERNPLIKTFSGRLWPNTEVADSSAIVTPNLQV
ncbi:MAG: hypothetical protein HZB54_07935 [Deltaproteobacteria bacterium]|nr:hypothetical protein [Deltaproteobacteria bacterium]